MKLEGHFLAGVLAITSWVSRRGRIACKLLTAAACATAVYSTTAPAADYIRYVSVTGSDANLCTLAAPCRSLQRGINRTPAGGELRILASGDYGTSASVTKSMTISGNGNTVFAGSPLTINQAGAVVTLRGLVLDGRGMVGHGIEIFAAAAVHIERCVIRGFPGRGIQAAPIEGTEVSVIDSIVRDNGDGIGIGSPASMATIDNSHFHNNTSSGVLVIHGQTTISRSTASYNHGSGIRVSYGVVDIMSTTATGNDTGFRVQGSGGILTVESSIAHGNNTAGLEVAYGRALISNSTFTHNGIGVSNGSLVETRQNNTIRFNGLDVKTQPLAPIGGM